MRGGRLRKRVEIWGKNATTNAHGEQVPGWALVETRWAAIEPLSGTERDVADKRVGEVSHRLVFRGLGLDLKPHMQARYKGRVFDLIAILNVDEIGAQVNVQARELVDES